MKLPNGCYVAEILIRQAEADCCEEPGVVSSLTACFVDGGGGHYPRLVEVTSFATDAGDLATVEKFLTTIAKANDAAMESYYKGGAESE